MEKEGRVRVIAMQREKRLDLSLLALKMETPMSQEILWPLEAEKGKKTNSPLQPPEGRQPC